ncbi:MAG: dihydropteroate synthase [Caulobacteraceae bacterium]|nr:dihydropteroate synthase [Caulobacteraceae bacterium]
MGVLNVTPDSFSDGGEHEQAAAPHALAMLEAGADIVDIGGESTRPGAAPVDDGQEIARVVPVIAALRAATKAPISIDTMKPSVAMAALQAGASMWNDVAALQSPGALETAAAAQRPVILMHMQGEPRTMQNDPRYDDAAALLAAQNGAAMVRVHDVAETVQALKVWRATQR